VTVPVWRRGEIHPTAIVSPEAQLGADVTVGPFAIVHECVRLGDGCMVGPRVTLGEPLRSWYRGDDGEQPTLSVGAGAVIRSGTVLYAGSDIGAGFESGHSVVIREHSFLGERCRVGTASNLEGQVRLGRQCTLQSDVHVAPLTVIGDFVWLFPAVVFTNDPCPPSARMVGTTVGDFAVIATGSVVLPGLDVGEDTVVAAGSVVRADVAPGTLVSGNPARAVGPARYILDPETRQPQYPWQHRFDAGMPWEGSGFAAWQAARAAGTDVPR
jgi:acyl-[acyl carrier protein]--UDP-N-acetylglucosamine O-acyltransferase